MLAKSDAVKYGVVTNVPAVAVGKQERSQSLWLGKAIYTVFVVFVVLGLAYVPPIGVSSQEQEVQQVRERVAQLANENEILQLKVNQLKSLERIQMIAETELGMVIPTAAVYSSSTASRR